jgi:dUTP pyrophosphatase
MNVNDIQDFISQLKNLEKEIIDSQEKDDYNESFISELDTLLQKLSTDIGKNQVQKVTGLQVKIKKLNEKAVIPKYSKPGDAGMDLTITSIISDTDKQITYGFGVAMEIPEGYVGLVFPRSSIRKYDFLLSNSVGVIDSGYRGEIQATFKKTNGALSTTYVIGDRGSQIMIIPYPQVEFIETDSLSLTERNEGGFGHTGN